MPDWKVSEWVDDSQAERVAVYIATYELVGPHRPGGPRERIHLLDFLRTEVAELNSTSPHKRLVDSA
jgi:hypothetical protein